MFIRIHLEPHVFRAFRLGHIISIEPIYCDGGGFEHYEVRLIDREQPLELSQKQGNQLIEMLTYKSIYPDLNY